MAPFVILRDPLTILFTDNAKAWNNAPISIKECKTIFKAKTEINKFAKIYN